MPGTASDSSPAPPGLRIDLWLHRARFVKTRALAIQAVSDGKIRLARNGQTRRISKAAQLVQIGDLLSISMTENVMTLIVLELPPRRGPAIEAGKTWKPATDHGSSENP